MKSRILLLSFVLCFNVLFSQKSTEPTSNPSLDPSLVPPAALNAFTSQNPGAAATWRKDGDNFRVNYIDQESKLGRAIIYDKNGEVLRREDEVDKMTYPGAIGDYYQKHHPGETYQVWKSEEQANGKPVYFSSRNEETLWFDRDGNLLPARKAEKAVRKK